MGWYDSLLQQGYVPSGVTPNVIDEQGQMQSGASYGTDSLSRLNRALVHYDQEQKAKEERQRELLKKRSDMYKTLRDSGYSPDKAYAAVESNSFPKEPGGETIQEKKINTDQRTAQVQKIRAQTDKIKAQTDAMQRNKPKLEDNILQKVADGVELTAGEQKVYDETIRKYGNKADLEAILSKKSETKQADKVKSHAKDTPEKKVPVISPDGKKGSVPLSKLKKALADGYKLP